MLLFHYLSLLYIEQRKRLTSHPWAVLGEGCSSARDSFLSPGAFDFFEKFARVGLTSAFATFRHDSSSNGVIL
jgi:hypothetical protein